MLAIVLAPLLRLNTVTLPLPLLLSISRSFVSQHLNWTRGFAGTLQRGLGFGKGDHRLGEPGKSSTVFTSSISSPTTPTTTSTSPWNLAASRGPQSLGQTRRISTMASEEALPTQCVSEVSKDAPASAASTELPKLSADDFRVYNRLAHLMNAYVCILTLPLVCCWARVRRKIAVPVVHR